MANDLQLGDDNDLNIDENTKDFSFVTQKDETKQKVEISLNTNLAELDWNEDFGINFLNLMYEADNKAEIQKIVNDYLNNTYGSIFDSVEITDVFKDRKNRNIKVNANIKMVNGESFTAMLGGDDTDNE